MTVEVIGGSLPSRDSFAWTVLTALAGEVDAVSDEGFVTVSLTKRRSLDLIPADASIASAGTGLA